MLLRTLAIAVLSLAGSAIAQCGTNSLSPVLLVSNNSGATGGAVYFQLNVLAANGISICGMDVNVQTGAGLTLGARVLRHTSLTDPFSLTAANNVAANWAELCAMTGTSNALNTLSPMTVSNGTNSLDLPFGPHLIAIVACPNWAHAYTSTATAPAWTVSNADLTHFGGRATNVPFVGTPFGSTAPTFTSARTAMIKFNYNLPGAPVTLSPAGVWGVCASNLVVGTNCTGVSTGASIHESWAAGTPDLIVPGVSSEDVLFTDAAGTVSVTTSPGTAIVPPVALNLGLGDDQNTALIPLGFTASIGGRSFTSISMASNGYVFLGALGAADFSPTAAELTAQAARIAPYWYDFAPNLGGTTHVDILPGLARVTWLACWGFGGTGPEATVQLEITASTMLIRYDPAVTAGSYTGAASARLVGFSNGVSHTAPLPVNLNGGSVPPVTGFVSPVAPVLAGVGLPFVGVPFVLNTTGMDPAGVGGTLVQIGPASAPVLLSAPFAANCNSRMGLTAITLALYFSSATGSTSITVPGGTAFLGLPVSTQSATIGGAVWAVSNALNTVFGNI